MAFSKLNLKSQNDLNAFELVAAFFCNWGFHHRMYYPLSQYNFIKALQLSLSHIFGQTYLEHVT
jgi:hypothetical protein